MPNRQKQLLFSTCALLALACALTAVVATGLPFWIRGAALCRTGAELVNATGPELDQFVGELSYGLFQGRRVKQCGLGGRTSRFSFFPDLVTSIPAGLHVSIIFFCGAVVVLSSTTAGFFFFNAFGRPYRTLQGPMGLYLWTLLSGVCSGLVVVLFAAEVKLHHLSQRVANFNELHFLFQTHAERYDRCYWLFLLVFLLHALNALLIRLAGVTLPVPHHKQALQGGGAADLMY